MIDYLHPTLVEQGYTQATAVNAALDFMGYEGRHIPQELFNLLALLSISEQWDKVEELTTQMGDHFGLDPIIPPLLITWYRINTSRRFEMQLCSIEDLKQAPPGSKALLNYNGQLRMVFKYQDSWIGGDFNDISPNLRPLIDEEYFNAELSQPLQDLIEAHAHYYEYDFVLQAWLITSNWPKPKNTEEPTN